VSGLTLAQRIIAIHEALVSIPHAFGGAIALAYYAEPRATIDIDLNVFVPAARYIEVAAALSRIGVATDDTEIARLVDSDGQARVLWDATPIDLFFAYDPFHEAAGKALVVVPFGESTIPILAVEHLIVCKVVFNRSRHWLDIEAILAVETPVNVAEVLRWVGRIAGDDDARYNRVAALLTHN
jgi:hypothetical protein